MKWWLALLLLAPADVELPPRAADALPSLQSERWSEALPVLEASRAANAYDGRTRLYLGIAYQGLDRHADAISELEAALDLGVTGNRMGMRLAHLALARSRLAAGDPTRALTHIEEAWAKWGFDDLIGLFDDARYSALHSDSRLRELAGLDPSADAGDRVARWRADLRYFDRLLRSAHRDPFHHVSPEAWRAEVDRLHAEIAHLEDRQVIAEFLRLAAQIGDGHTAVYPPTEGPHSWHLLPIFPVRMRDGWFVAAADDEHADLVGARILGSEGASLDRVLAFARSRLPRDNEFTARWLSGLALQFSEMHSLAAATSGEKGVTLRVQHEDGREIRRVLSARPADRNPNAPWAPSGWATAYERPPRWLREPTRIFHHEKLDEAPVVYARMLQLADTEDVGLEAYGREIHDRMAESGAEGLVLDLRLNNGGDANEARAFVNELIRIPALRDDRSLAVLIGPRSYSATGYVLGMLEKHLSPVFVGWPSGCRPVKHSSERFFRLPYSGLTGSISYELRVDGGSTDDRRPAFFPDYMVWPDGQDLRRGHDPVLETALRSLR